MRAAALFLLFALSACGAEAQDAPAAPPSPAPSVGAKLASPAPEASPTHAVADGIPNRFLDVWDGESGACDGLSDLRLEIASGTIDFYESHGTVKRVKEFQDGSVLVDLAMEGEGETWNTAVKLQLVGSGEAQRLLSLPDPDSGILLRPVRLKRCPA